MNYIVKCVSKAKQNQTAVNKYIKYDLAYQELSNTLDAAPNGATRQRIERRLEAMWERQEDIASALPLYEIKRADKAMRSVRGY